MGSLLTMILPELVTLEQFHGQWDKYLAHIYKVFIDSIVNAKLQFLGKPIRCAWHPPYQDMHFSFWHIISQSSENKGEENRIPDMRRCERIAWIGHLINNANNLNEIWCWQNERPTSRGANKHVLLYHHSERFLVVLREKPDCYQIATAYSIEQEHRHRKLFKEKEECIDPRNDKGRH